MKKQLNKEDVKKIVNDIAKKMREQNIKPNDRSVSDFLESEESLSYLKDCSCTSGGNDISFDLISIDVEYNGTLIINVTESEHIENIEILYHDTHLDFEFFNEEKIVVEFSIFYDYLLNGKYNRQPIVIYRAEV